MQTQREIEQQKAEAAGAPLQQQPYKLRDALAWATINAAESLGLEDKIGSLKPGKQADIILIRTTDLNVFLDKPEDVVVQAHPGNVDTVIIAGRILKRHGKLVGVDDLQTLREKAKEAYERLVQ